MNLELQNLASDSLRKGLLEYDKRKGWRGPLDNRNNKDWYKNLEKFSLEKTTYFLSRWLKPGPSPAWARFWKSGYLEIQKFGIQEPLKNENDQNPNQCRPKCRQGLDWPQKELPGNISCRFISFFPLTEKQQKTTLRFS